MKSLTRRGALSTGLFGALASCAPQPRLQHYSGKPAKGAAEAFRHGVASGDPAADSVVLWTRIAPAPDNTALSVDFEVAEDADFAKIIARGAAATGPERDYTVKALATGLSPGRHYFYRFRSGEAVSPVGRTKTLPIGAYEAARFAVVSCSNYPFGYFNVYDLIARQEGLDAVLHLGDYIYEYGPEGYGGAVGAKLGRPHAPAREIVTLADYRTRHAQYKADPATQAMHAAHPMIAIWDDHEIADNSWAGGAENHQPETEGPWEARKRAGLQAYYEWMPVREPTAAPEDLFRSFSYGDLLTIIGLETRLMARVKQLEYSDIVPKLTSPEAIADFRKNVLGAPDRDLMGPAQLAFVRDAITKSKAAGQKWRVVANQVVMANVIAPDLRPHVTEKDIAELEKQWDQARAFVQFSALGLPANLDSWDGYPAAREKLYATAKEEGSGLLVLSGDSHTWWANDLIAADGAHVGVELGVTSVTSPSPFRKEFLGGKGAEYALLTNKDNKSVRYLSGEHHGYVDLVVTRDKAEARYVAVDTIDSADYDAFDKAKFTIGREGDTPHFSGADGLSLRERVLFG